MPIARRSIPTDAVLQVPASKPKEYAPSKGAVLDVLSKPDDIRAAGHLMYAGREPKEMPFDDVVAMARAVDNDANLDNAYRERVKGRLSAIRAWCVLDLGSAKRVRSCENIGCPLWPFRMGTNPYRRRK